MGCASKVNQRRNAVGDIILKIRTLLQVLLFISIACTAISARKTYKLRVTEDVSLERSFRNYNYLPYLLLGTHPGFPLKRSLMKFQDIPCECSIPLQATLHIYFVYAHKASYMSTARVPSKTRYVVAHTVLKSWTESQATNTKRYNGAYWSQPWLKLGTDARTCSSPATRVPPLPVGRWFTVDVTRQAVDWRFGQNYGLLLRDTHEKVLGRGFRFASNAYQDKSKHAYITLTC